MAHSTALVADSVDMLGDAIVYGFSLYVIHRGTAWHARAAVLKGIIMAAFGIGVLIQVAVKIVDCAPPRPLKSWARSAPWHLPRIFFAWCSYDAGVTTISTCGRRRSAHATT